MHGVCWVMQLLPILPKITFRPALHHGESKQLDIMTQANGVLGRKVSSETRPPRTWPISPLGLTSTVLRLLANGQHHFTLLMPRIILQPAAMWTTLVIAVAQAAQFLQLQTTLSVLVTAVSALPTLLKPSGSSSTSLET